MNHAKNTEFEAERFLRIALLIDGDNASASTVSPMLAEVARFGTITVRRVYGDWTTPQMSGWKKHLQSHAVQPIQQFRYTTGKNATDSSLIIDAMDLLHSGTVDGFCIASSDSDFTRLATRIREHGFFVMGVGRRQTPESFVNACQVFVYTENFTPADSPKEESEGDLSDDADWTKLIADSIDATTGDSGIANLANVGAFVRTLDPAFDPRRYGFKKFSELLNSRPDLFEVFEEQRQGKPPVLFVRCSPTVTARKAPGNRTGPSRAGRRRKAAASGAETQSKPVRRFGSGVIGRVRKRLAAGRDAS